MSVCPALVSVIIPAYNARQFLESAVESVEAQTYKNYELILVDDGSTDGTAQWAETCPGRFRYYGQENQGQAAARNRGASLANGEYLAFLDADDLWQPEKLMAQVNALSTAPDRSFVFTDGYRLVSAVAFRELSTCPQNYPRLSSLYVHPADPLPFEFQFRINCVPTSSLFVRKRDYITVGGMPDIRQGEDFILVCLLLLRSPAIYLDTPLIFYRVHSDNISARVKGRRQSFRNLRGKDAARIKLAQLVQSSDPVPGILWNYARLPWPMRLFALMHWRMRYGASRRKILSDVIRYLRA